MENEEAMGARGPEAMDRMRLLTRCLVVIAVVLIGTLGGSKEVSAEESDAQAQAIANHERGLELYDAGSYAEAAQAFESAQALEPEPSNLFNLARCYEHLGDVARAIRTFEQYLASNLTPERRERGQAELTRLRAIAQGGASPQAEVDLVVVTEPPGAEVLIDGRPQTQRTPAVVPVQPGTRMVEVRLEGYQHARQEVDVEAGQAARVEMTMEADPDAVMGGGGEEPAEARRRVLTLGGGLGLGFSALFASSARMGGLGDLELFLGGRFGTARSRRGMTFWPLRFEGLLYVSATVPGDENILELLEVGAGGRISLAPLQFPLRFEGEGSLAYGYRSTGSTHPHHLLGVLKFVVVYQVRPWLEVGACPVRLDLIGKLGPDGGEQPFFVRYGLEAVIRFRY